MTIKIYRTGNHVFMYDFTKGGYGHLCDTRDGVSFSGDIELLKLFNGTRRGLVDDDRLGALYRSVEGGVKPKD